MRIRLLAALALTVALLATFTLTVSAHYPVENRYSYISQGFHSGHRGFDLAAPYGTIVSSASGGRVVFTGWRNNCGGYQVYVYQGRAGDGRPRYMAYYHLSRIVTYVGEYLSTNENLGRVGTTGCTTGPHLHVERWVGYPWARGSFRVHPWWYIDHGFWLPFRYR